MKTILCLLLVFLIYFTTKAQQQQAADRFILNGKINGIDTGFVFISYLNKNEKEVKDSTSLKNGTFRFEGIINGGTLASVYKKKTTDPNNISKSVTFFLEPVTININIDNNNYQQAIINGSAPQNEILSLEALKKPVFDQIDSIIVLLDQVNLLLKNNNDNAELNKQRLELTSKRSNLNELRKEIDYNFITKNSNSYISPYTLLYYFRSKKISLDSAVLLLSRLTPVVQNSLYGGILTKEINGRRNSSTGSLAPVFTKIDLSGKEISLESFRGKQYVLLDFWASWCVPCREFSSTLKSFYKKYQSKGLEIISISWDADPKTWKQAIKEDNLNSWYHILASMYEPNDLSMRGKYSIPSIPLLILIDKNGVIAGRYMALDEDGGAKELKTKLEEIFDKNNN